jgi:predicted protein tyrosine phosphatase
MDIRICGYIPASFLLEHESGHWDTILVVDSTAAATDFVALHACRHLVLQFDDVECATVGRQAPTTEQIARGLDFACGSQRLLISCRAGQSRSAAMAYLAGCQVHGVEAAIRLINPKRHIPNRLIITLGAAILDMPDVLAAFEQWEETNRHIVLSDYYDEIERELDKLEAQGAVNRLVVE